MVTAAVLISLASISELAVDVTRLDGQRLSGPLESLSAEEVIVVVDGASRRVPTAELQEIRPAARRGGLTASAAHADVAVTFRDGSLLLPGEFTATAREATIVHPRWGEIRVPKSALASVRLARSDQSLSAAWETLLARPLRNDLVVVRKGDALDHVEGVVGTINAESVTLLLDGQSIPIPRSRVFGIIYTGDAAVSQRPLCRFDLLDGERLVALAAKLEGSDFQVRLAADAEVTITGDFVERIDFSLGKIRALSDFEPIAVNYPPGLTPELASVWRFRRGRNSRGQPLLLGGRSYDEGLWIHSGTTLRYRLGREYRRLQGLTGIDEDIGECNPRVGLVIRGDGRVLLDVQLQRGEPVRELDVDVTDVRELEITVTSTDPEGVCEHLDLVEARLIK